VDVALASGWLVVRPLRFGSLSPEVIPLPERIVNWRE
jgi:hypothetical protein